MVKTQISKQARWLYRAGGVCGGVLLASSCALAQGLSVNGGSQTASGVYAGGTTAPALSATNNGVITSTGPLTLSSSYIYGVLVNLGGNITIGNVSTPASTLTAGMTAGESYALFTPTSASASITNAITTYATDIRYSGTGSASSAVYGGQSSRIVLNGGSLSSTASPEAMLNTLGTITANGTTITDAGARYGVEISTAAGGTVTLTNSSLTNNTSGGAISAGTNCATTSGPCSAVYLLNYEPTSMATFNATNTAIATSGTNRTGVQLAGYTTATLIGGSVTTKGDGGDALYIVGMTGGGATGSGTIKATGTQISTSGVQAYGATVTGGTLTLDKVSINTSGQGGWGVFAYNATSQTATSLAQQVIGKITMTDSSVTTTGANAYGVAAEAGGVVNMTGGTVTTSGAGAVGLHSGFTDRFTWAQLNANDVQVTTSGQGAHGAYVVGGGGANAVILSLTNGTVIDAQGAGSAALYDATAAAHTIKVQDSALISEQSVGVYLTNYCTTSGGATTCQPPSTLNLPLNNSTLTGAAAAWVVVNGNTLNLIADASTLTGAALLNGASIANVTLQNGSTWNAPSDSVVTTLTLNKSQINVGAASAPGTTLTVNGDYTGAGGTIAFHTVLEDDNSVTDKMVVGGSVSGSTQVLVTNAGGGGAQTTGDGIKLVQVGGTSDTGAFTLSKRVAAGAYEYLLYRGGVGTNASDQNWYLRSDLIPTPPQDDPTEPADPTEPPQPTTPTQPAVPTYRPEVMVNSAIPALASRLGLAMLGTWHDRTGGEFIPVDAGSAAPAEDSHGHQVWARLFGQTGRAGPGGNGSANRVSNFERDGSTYDYTYGGIQTGMDVLRRNNADGSLDIAGFYVGVGSASAKIQTPVDFGYGSKAGTLSMTGISVAGYGTHVGASGWYVDTVLQGTRYQNISASSIYPVDSQTLKTQGFGLLGSLEAGYPFALGQDWKLEPQAQLVYQHLSLNNGADAFGRISYSDSDALYGRLGARLEKDLTTEDGRRMTAYARANVWTDMGAKSHTTFSNTQGENALTFGTALGGTWSQFGLGMSGQLTKRAAIEATLAYNQGLSRSAGHSVGGMVGVKFAW